MTLNTIGRYCIRWSRRHIFDSLKNSRRQIRRVCSNPRLAFDYHLFRRAIKKRDWRKALERLGKIALIAERVRETRLLTEMAHAAGRLGEYQNATQWAYANDRICGKIKPNDWQGDDLSGAMLVIYFKESEKQGLAIGLNMSGYVAEAAAKASNCILVVERRLVPIFSRTLPKVKVMAFPAKIPTHSDIRIVTANPLILKSMMGTTPPEIESRFIPVKADLEVSGEMRKSYQNGRNLPLVGISWWSSHFGKDLPSPEVWADLVRTQPAIFINLQYGDVAKDLQLLKQAAPDRVITDETVDQLVDMDRFASQLGALDAVVTISNTGAHLAGAMKVPTLLIRDDWFRRGWPVLSNKTPWYPATTVFGKEGRPWQEVFSEVEKKLLEVTAVD